MDHESAIKYHYYYYYYYYYHYVSPKAVFPGQTLKCFPQVSGNTMQQVETLKYLGMVFTSDESRNKGIDTRIGKANAVLRELYCSVVTKRELSKNAKLSVFKSVFIPILAYGHESSVTTERINAVKKMNGRGGIFAKSFWCDTS